MLGLTEIPIGRRFVITIVACTIAAVIFRGQVATALVSRGDDFLTRGNLAMARSYYLRAIRFDPSLGAAVDRFVFFGFEQRTPEAIHDGIAIASVYLRKHPKDKNVLVDRALCYQQLKNYRSAARDFMQAAIQDHDARYFTFAGWAFLRAGDRRGSFSAWRAALAAQPSYGPAKRALQKLAP